MIDLKVIQQLFPVTNLDTEPGRTPGEVRLVGDLQPTLALLVGKGVNGLALAEITSGGEVKTAQSGSGFEDYQVIDATSTNTATSVAVAQQSSRLDIKLITNDVEFAFQKSDDSWLGDINLDPGSYSIDFSFKDVRITSGTADEHGVVQLVAWY